MFYCMFILLVIAPLAPRFSRLMQRYCIQERSQKFVSEGDKTRGLGEKSPSRSRGRALVEVWGQSPQKLKTYTLITKNPYFLSKGISGGGHVPLVPPSLRP